ncbi:DUF2271 domain-containing protein [Marinospirillum sp.]|uniref:DUF2271 domain-containing protein n=1 Tax=Marinospirillum sp. TaxID=2183934 RepID=UPI0028707EE4|nr:DUF2271 domain-containing protein [Marinospirillum sp.]MDR9466879.1 DUF2271 domain-containing protein [Marinospirillum sp.]
MKKIFACSFWLAMSFAPLVQAGEVTVGVKLPELDEGKGYRPYVAVWVENEHQEVVKTLAVWRKEADWLKDMRRWWRKAGRYDQGELDAVTGATRRPGVHQVVWEGDDQEGQPVADGRYTINIEAAREHGSRSQVTQIFELGQAQEFITEAAEELGSMTITVKP